MVRIVGVGGTLRDNSRSYHALEVAIHAAAAQGAETELLSLMELDLPMFRPRTEVSAYGENVQRLIKALRSADGVMFSTGAYHGILAGVTKNMLDFIEFMHDDDPPFLHNRPVGLIAVAGGTIAAVNTIDSLIHTVHALRGIVVPLTVPIHRGSKVFQDGKLVDVDTYKRLTALAEETVRLAKVLHPQVVGV